MNVWMRDLALRAALLRVVDVAPACYDSTDLAMEHDRGAPEAVPSGGGRHPVGRRSDHGSLIELLDAVVGAEAAAYTTDRYGQVANPAATCQVRDLMHQLAELIFQRDGCYPPWWRAVGEVA